MALNSSLGKTVYVYLSGKTKWFRPNILNPWDKWSHVLYLDNKSLECVRELQGDGVKNKLSKDDDGWFVNLSRPKEIKIRGRMQPLAPPEVLDKKGEKLDPSILVGNGSDVTTKMEVYPHRTPNEGRAKAMRWMSTRIDNLVPYERERDQLESEERLTRGLEERPVPLF